MYSVSVTEMVRVLISVRLSKLTPSFSRAELVRAGVNPVGMFHRVA